MTDDTLQHISFDGSAEYNSALDAVCGAAIHTLSIFEKNFEGLGFNDEARCEKLRRFLLDNPANRLQLLAHDPQHLVRYCPRIMSLLGQFSNSMSIYQTPKHLRHISDPFAVADNAHYVRRYHFDAMRGVLGRNDPEEARRLNGRFHEIWNTSHPAATATTLGL